MYDDCIRIITKVNPSQFIMGLDIIIVPKSFLIIGIEKRPVGRPLIVMQRQIGFQPSRVGNWLPTRYLSFFSF